MVKEEKKKVIFTIGKRKESVARAVLRAGTGKITINSTPLEVWSNQFQRMRIREPILIAGDLSQKVDIDVEVVSGGTTGQVEAARMAIARGLVSFGGNKQLKQKFIEYDRNLLVFDPRRNETHHAGGASKRGSRRHKQRSKR